MSGGCGVNPGPGEEAGKSWVKAAGPAEKLWSYFGLTQVTQAWIKVNAFAVGNKRCFLRNIFKNRNLMISIFPNVCCILTTF